MTLVSTYFGTANVTLWLTRTNNLVLIQIQAFNISPTVTGELISDTELTEQWLPKDGQIIPSLAYIHVNGTATVGCAYVGTDRKIHISASDYVGSPFQAGAIDCGPRYGATISFTN